MMMPLAYELKRIVARHRDKFWCASGLSDMPAAPVYLFPDQELFDSDEVDEREVFFYLRPKFF